MLLSRHPLLFRQRAVDVRAQDVPANAGQLFDFEYALRGNALPLVDRATGKPESTRQCSHAAGLTSGKADKVFGVHSEVDDSLTHQRSSSLSHPRPVGKGETGGMAPPKPKQDRPEPLSQDQLAAIGDRLAQELKRKKVSQSKAAKSVGVERSAVNHWCHGRNMPSVAQLVRLADAYKIDVQYVLIGRNMLSPQVLAMAERIAALSPEQFNGMLQVFQPEPVENSKVETAGFRAPRAGD